MNDNPSPPADAESNINQKLAEKTGVDRDGRPRPTKFSWIIPALASLLVALWFFAGLETGGQQLGAQPAAPELNSLADVPAVSKAIKKDLGVVVESQLRTFGILALYALIPGLFGMIYRKKFWHWFLSAFGALFVLNLFGFLAGIGSLSMDMLKRLHYDYWIYVAIELGLVALLLGFRLRRHVTLLPSDAPQRKPKNIVICLDGTWNHPGQTDWGHLAQTNVFKLFDSLLETPEAELGHFNASRCKRYVVNGEEKQVALYYNGVGNKIENSFLGEKIGGAFGMGAEAIKERAYLDAAREYQPGDKIFIFGFSRGAALARLVANALDKRGVPRSVWTLRLFGRQRPVKTSNEHVPALVEVLGCWDTVGSFGMSKNIMGIPFQQINLLKDLTVPLCVKRAYHLVALDEDRDCFVPTLMDLDPTRPNRIVEVWFSGNHSNVGGGFATDGLSDHTLSFMLEHVTSGWDPQTQKTTEDRSWGLYLKPHRRFHPNPLGKLRVSGGAMYDRFPRPIPLGATIHDSVFRRIRHDESDYVPESLFVLNQAVHKLRNHVTGEVEILQRTKSLTEEEAREVADWVDRRLTLQKWSKWRDAASIDPHTELANA